MTDFLQDIIENTNCELYHHGVLGQKWGVRRYQNKDGSLTPMGKKHFLNLSKSSVKKYKQKQDAAFDASREYDKKYKAVKKEYEKSHRKLTAKEIKEHGMKLMDQIYTNKDYDHSNPKAREKFYKDVFERRYDAQEYADELNGGKSPNFDKLVKQKCKDVYKNYKKTAKAVDKYMHSEYMKARLNHPIATLSNNYKALNDEWGFRREMFNTVYLDSLQHS
jgi:hypothetical protein